MAQLNTKGNVRKPRIAVVFPADAQALATTLIENTRLTGVAEALTSAGAEVVSAPFCDEIEERLSSADVALVWFNP